MYSTPPLTLLATRAHTRVCRGAPFSLTILFDRTILFDGFELLRNPGADEQLSEEECRTAAAMHGWAISVVNSSDRPKGCHYSPEDISSPAFFYNAYAGKAFSSTAYGGNYPAVCKASPKE